MTLWVSGYIKLSKYLNCPNFRYQRIKDCIHSGQRITIVVNLFIHIRLAYRIQPIKESIMFSSELWERKAAGNLIKCHKVAIFIWGP